MTPMICPHIFMHLINSVDQKSYQLFLNQNIRKQYNRILLSDIDIFNYKNKRKKYEEKIDILGFLNMNNSYRLKSLKLKDKPIGKRTFKLYERKKGDAISI